MRKFKTVPVEPSDLAHYRRRAEECFRLAKTALDERLWFGACINAVHAGIALADCLCVFLRGTRYAGTSHDEAIQVYSLLSLKKPDFPRSIQNLGKLISIKNAAEYADRPIGEKDAVGALKSLERLRDFVLGELPPVQE